MNVCGRGALIPPVGLLPFSALADDFPGETGLFSDSKLPESRLQKMQVEISG